MEEFEYKGLWFLPKFPNHQVSGIIKFHPVDGAMLEITGNDFDLALFEPRNDRDHLNLRVGLVTKRDRDIQIVLGYTEQGDPVTLYGCFWNGHTWATGYSGAKYRVQIVLIGQHFEKYEDIIFDSISIHYIYLEQWLGITGFSGHFTMPNKRKTISGQIKYKSPKRLKIRVNDFNISFYYDFYLSGDRFVDIHAEQKTFIEIIPDQRLHYSDYQSNIIYHIRNFLTLGIGKPVLPLLMQGRIKSQKITVTIYQIIKGSTLNKKQEIQRGKMLFRYQDISDNFSNHLKNWFDKAYKMEPIFDLYFGLSYIPSIYVHLEFLTLAQCLETYHRRMYGGVYLPVEEYETIRNILNQAIPKDIDSSHRSSLKSRIQFGYEYSLRKRLGDILTTILDPYKEITEKLIGDKNKFIGSLVDTRNYLTHYTEELEKVAIIEPQEQYAFVQKMKILMQMCFFVELGFPIEVVNKLMENNDNFKFWSMRRK